MKWYSRSMSRLDHFLHARFPNLSRAFLQKLIRDGCVHLRGKVLRKPHSVIREGEADFLTCGFPALQKLKMASKKLPMKIIYEDKDLIVLDKPAGISVHPSATEKGDTVVSFLLSHCKDLSGIGGIARPGIVHRLDRNTSGILVVAKNDAAHRALSRQWVERNVKKEYMALVVGILPHKKALIDAPIARSMHNRKKMAVSARTGSRESVTEYEVAKTFGEKYTLVKAFPKTGRTHQIRVHFASIGHPVVGDSVYGGPSIIGLARQFLHASKLTLTHPRTGKKMVLTSKLPKDLEGVLNIIKKKASTSL